MVMLDTPGHTIDAFHRGRFFLVQPAQRGHRAGMDAMLLASAVPDDFSGVLADLGAGAGAAGMAVLARCGKAQAVLIEKSADMAGYAQRSIDLQQNTRFRGRVEILEADVALTGARRRAAGLQDRSFDFVIMNPPFNRSSDRRTPDAMKAEAHVMADELFQRWLRTASAILKPAGRLALIARPGSLTDILNALTNRFGEVAIFPVLPKSNAAAIRIIITAMRGSRAELSIRPPIVLHDGQSRDFTHRADSLINGESSLTAGT